MRGDIRLGLLAYASNGGLGSQTWEYYRWFEPAKTLVADLSQMDGKSVHFSRYPDGVRTVGFPTNAEVDNFLEGLDVVLCAETPLNYYLFDAARKRGIKTALMYNYEFLDYMQWHWPKPDILISPSPWHSEVEKLAGAWGCQWAYLPMPVNRKYFPFKKKKQAKTFLHIAGHPAHEDRNGTRIVYDAIPLVKSDVKFVIRSQADLPQFDNDYRVTVDNTDYPNYWEVFRDEDVLLLPRRYGGLSLQLNEALSSGMITVMSDVSPQNTFLPKQWLVEAPYYKTIQTRSEIELFNVDPSDLAQKIDELANLPEELIGIYSDMANELASQISWDRMLPQFEKLLCNL